MVNNVISWQKKLANSTITKISELAYEFKLDFESIKLLEQADKHFPIKIPLSFLSKINKSDPQDPILLQVLPSAKELIKKIGFSDDPLKEDDNQVLPGLLHKYHGRVLMIVNSVCAIHCRYCFRRLFNYKRAINIQHIVEYLKSQKSIKEVILSGGDPLLLSDRRIRLILKELGNISHIERLRIHSRQPIVLPERINPSLLDILSTTRLKTIIVVHTNHMREIDNDVRAALAKLSAIGITLLNQSVLLNGINDDINTLKILSETLFSTNVLPYYLHMLDPVSGTIHYEVEEQKAIFLINELKKILPGYLIPRLVREEAGKLSKVFISS